MNVPRCAGVFVFYVYFPFTYNIVCIFFLSVLGVVAYYLSNYVELNQG